MMCKGGDTRNDFITEIARISKIYFENNCILIRYCHSHDTSMYGKNVWEGNQLRYTPIMDHLIILMPSFGNYFNYLPGLILMLTHNG